MCVCTCVCARVHDGCFFKVSKYFTVHTPLWVGMSEQQLQNLPRSGKQEATVRGIKLINMKCPSVKKKTKNEKTQLLTCGPFPAAKEGANSTSSEM